MNARTLHHTATASGILVASSDDVLRNKVVGRLATGDSMIFEAFGGADALGKLESSPCRLLLVEPHLPDLNMDEFIHMVEMRYPGTDVVLLDADTGEPQLPAELRHDSLYQALVKTTAPEERMVRQSLRREPELPAFDPLPGMIGNCPAMRHLTRMVRLVAHKESTVLITGETGTGKELVANAVHQLSSRAKAPYVTVNCAAIPETLLEAELFGYARGAFTGAVNSRIGKIQSASGGTLFLDEIGEMPSAIQAKLLRFLQSGEVQRLGSTETQHADVRIIAATNAQLPQMVSSRNFREDLYYRLAVFPVELPPLRLRGDDILLLARHFLAAATEGMSRLLPEAELILESHNWPGNVRELQHVIERAAILAEDEEAIGPEQISLMMIPAHVN